MVTRDGKSFHAIGIGTIEKSKPTLRKNGEGWGTRQAIFGASSAGAGGACADSGVPVPAEVP
jgi:hypothetical protein